MRKLVALLSVFIGFAVITLAACSGSDNDSAALDGKTFTGQTLVLNGAEVAAADGQTISVTFVDGSISINGGCNTLFGEATWAGGEITLATETLASTMMACSEPLMAQDQALIAFFSSSPTWSLSGSTLTLKSDTAPSISEIVLEQTS